jgi:hypothetical protein
MIGITSDVLPNRALEPSRPPSVLTYRCGARLSAGRYVAGMSDGWWLTPSGNGGPLEAISGH